MDFSVHVLKENLIPLISIPLIAALIGWFTNWVAVKMLFRPRNPWNVFGLRIQGLVPRRQRELAESIGETVQRDLVSHKDVQEVLKHTDIELEVRKLVEGQIESFMGKMLGENPMIAMFVPQALAAKIKDTLIHQMAELAPSFLDRMMQQVEDKLDFKAVVREKIESFDLSKLEEIIYRISKKELRTIELLGGVIGFTVGLVQVAIMLASK